MRSALILAGLAPVYLVLALIVAMAVGRRLKASRLRAHREIVDRVLPPLCDCEQCDPDARPGRLK